MFHRLSYIRSVYGVAWSRRIFMQIPIQVNGDQQPRESMGINWNRGGAGRPKSTTASALCNVIKIVRIFRRGEGSADERKSTKGERERELVLRGFLRVSKATQGWMDTFTRGISLFCRKQARKYIVGRWFSPVYGQYRYHPPSLPWDNDILLPLKGTFAIQPFHLPSDNSTNLGLDR